MARADRPGATDPLHDDRLRAVGDGDKGVELALGNDDLSVCGPVVVSYPHASAGGRVNVQVDWRWVKVDCHWDRGGQVQANGIECTFGALSFHRDLTGVDFVHH